MARGITETEVHSAADALVIGGERPTVERIRAHLGTGSPNTVVRWLDTWWKGLGERLEARRAGVNLPDAPEEVSELASQLWSVALAHADFAAKAALAADREALDQARVQVDRERQLVQDEVLARRRDAADACHARDVSIARAEELARLVRQLETQLEGLGHQRADAEARAKDADLARQEAENRLLLLQEQSVLDRKSLTRHVQAVEDRAHGEVDRARRETQELKRELAAHGRDRAASDATNLRRLEEVRSELALARQEAAVERSKAEALERQLLHLRDLPAALTSALERAKPKPKPKRRRPTKAHGPDAG